MYITKKIAEMYELYESYNMYIILYQFCRVEIWNRVRKPLKRLSNVA